MSKKIENKIRIQAAIIYMIVTVVIGAMVIYLNELRTKVNYQRENIENQHQILSLTNELVYAVSETQSLSGLYLFTKNRTYKRKYNESQELIGALMDSISFLKPEVEDTFDRISILLYNQNKNISRLNKHLSDNTPVKELTKKLKEFEQPIKNDTIILNVHNDTVVNEIVRKGFFKRLGQVFKPSQDSARLIITQRVDTIKGISADSLSIIYDEVENIAQQAGLAYEKSLKDIERQVALLVKADNEISVELSALLMDFQKETLETTLSLIDESQAMIETNYSYSVWAGVICLILIMLLIFLIIADVNKGYKARMALEKANETIKQTMESRHKLLLSVSHDIKTPLNSIMGYLELMKEKENTSSMISSGTHILSMLDNLLEFSSLEQGKLQISNSDFNLKTVSEDIFQMFMPLAEKKNLSLTYDSVDIRINSDQLKIKQLIINLLSNAVKYTVEGEIYFSVEYADGILQMKVEDTGAGIPENKIQELYKPFSRIEENNALASGTGLGLFVTKGIVDILGGEIKINSIVGGGTMFDIKIPVKESESVISRKTHRIKVYDDDALILKMITEMVERLGHKAVDEDYDIIITDMDMGDISGLDILNQAGDTPVYLMTGQCDFTSQKGADMGFAGYMPKPVTLNVLKEMIGVGVDYEELQALSPSGTDKSVSEQSFADILGDDYEEIRSLFINSVKDNYSLLKKALADDDFYTAQAVCHKMLPMFSQFGYPTQELETMDRSRKVIYDNWKIDVSKVLEIEVL